MHYEILNIFSHNNNNMDDMRTEMYVPKIKFNLRVKKFELSK
jgi:hypothetical protein